MTHRADASPRPACRFPLAALLCLTACAAPKAELWDRWQAHDPGSATVVDHSAWAELLDRYVVESPDGVNLFRYAAVSDPDRRALDGYLERLQGLAVSDLDREAQLAYWINLYNALTVQVILDHYPVASIKEIDGGPWDEARAEVEGEPLSLNDVEHRILRPIWQDSRIHYAVNCASIGCPDLRRHPYTADRVEAMLEAAAREHVNDPRGARFDGGELVVSSLYDWYQDDFGGSEPGVLEHLRRHAEGELQQRLDAYEGGLRYTYDWSLNEAR